MFHACGNGAVCGLAVALLSATRVAAQDTTGVPRTLSIGSIEQRFLRYEQSLDSTARTPWSLRPFAPHQIASMQTGSMVLRAIGNRHIPRLAGTLSLSALPADIGFVYNTTYPFGWNDAAVWKGRGTTLIAEGGAEFAWGILTATVKPLVFYSENRLFSLLPVADTGSSPFADAFAPRTIDRPQRFGDASFVRVDPGQTMVRVDLFGLTAGVSTANQWLGPMSEWPYILGDNAAGFPHVFAGIQEPLNVGIGRIQGRLFYGRLSQSDFTTVPDSSSYRFTTGIVGIFLPRGLPGLELGAARMFEYRWPDAGLSWPDFRKPFESILKEFVKGDPGMRFNRSADNQEASAFVRWVVPGSGFEAYAELGREDHNWNLRDFIASPDHSASHGLGARKAWRDTDSTLHGFRIETIDLDPSILARTRKQGFKYTHALTRQGHTEEGQLLGVGFTAIDGGGALIGWDWLKRNGNLGSMSLSRLVMHEQTESPALDVMYAFSADRSRRKGLFDVTVGLSIVYEMNRDFGGDAGNVQLRSGIRW
jgi:hypothetical protein